MRDIPDCRCECKKKLNICEIKNIVNKFVNLKIHTKQNIYLQGCLIEIVPHIFHPREKNSPLNVRNQSILKYLVYAGNRTVEVYQKALVNSHGI